ncbi:MAG: universal stress protein [Nitrospirota bacterium]|nr:universal stress protein [Nitrospirota bacterium]
MNILVAHDGSAQADKALKRATDIAVMTKSAIVVLSVVPDLCMMEISDDDCKSMYNIMTGESEKRLAALKDDLSKKGVEMETSVLFGNAADIIISTCAEKKADLVVVGSHGRHGAKKFLLGSVSSKVVEHAHCDVLVVK